MKTLFADQFDDRNRQYDKWKRVDFDHLLNAYMEGHHTRVVAQMLNRDHESVKRKIGYLMRNEKKKLAKYKPTPERVSRIGHRYNRSDYHVAAKSIEYGFDLKLLARFTGRSIEEADDLLKSLTRKIKKGASQLEIQKLTGMNARESFNLIVRLGGDA